MTYNAGQLPDAEALETVSGKLVSTKSLRERTAVWLDEGGTPKTDKIIYRLTQAAPQAMSLTATIDLTLVESFQATNPELLPMPAANVTIAANGALSVAAGARESNEIEITFTTDGLAAGTYLLPVVVGEGEAGQVVYYGVRVRGLELGTYELDTEYTHVFYLNTTHYQPLLADRLFYDRFDLMTTFESTYRTVGNIVNLRVTTLGYDEASKRALFVLSPDMQYVVEHADKYIRPLQDKGRKVCFSIEGAGTGLGFCNLNDTQIADFVTQVKYAVEHYRIDGVNFFDRNSGYGKEGMPAMNTTSYPKLIKALREALGPDRLITLSDYEEPTEYFWDTAATGGIAVGDYIDYAWSGYMSENEDIQILDPWQNNMTPDEAAGWGAVVPMSKYDRKAIAGLSPEHFGFFAVPWYAAVGGSADEFLYYPAQGFTNLMTWRMLGYSPNNIVVWADLISNSQGTYEASYEAVTNMLAMNFFYDNLDWSAMYSFSVTGEGEGSFYGYGYMLKDW